MLIHSTINIFIFIAFLSKFSLKLMTLVFAELDMKSKLASNLLSR